MLKAARLVDLKHEGPYLGQLALLLVNNSDHIHRFGSQVVKSAQVHILESHVDKIAEFLSLFLYYKEINRLHS